MPRASRTASQPDFLAAVESTYRQLDGKFDALYAACASPTERQRLRDLHAAARDTYWQAVVKTLTDDSALVVELYGELAHANKRLTQALRQLDSTQDCLKLASEAVRLAASLVTLAAAG